MWVGGGLRWSPSRTPASNPRGLEEVETAGGTSHVYVIGSPVHIPLLAGGRELRRVRCNILVSQYIDEVLLSDYLIDELGIRLVSFRRGSGGMRAIRRGP